MIPDATTELTTAHARHPRQSRDCMSRSNIRPAPDTETDRGGRVRTTDISWLVHTPQVPDISSKKKIKKYSA